MMFSKRNYKLWSIWEVNKSSWQIMICMQNSYYYILHLVKCALYIYYNEAAKKDIESISISNVKIYLSISINGTNQISRRVHFHPDTLLLGMSTQYKISSRLIKIWFAVWRSFLEIWEDKVKDVDCIFQYIFFWMKLA